MLPNRTRVSRWAAAVLALVLALSSAPAPAAKKDKGPDLSSYRGLAAWVDIFDDQGWADPEGVVALMAQYGVRTLFLETCNYQCVDDVHRPLTLSRWIDAAHGAGMKVVAWYLPGFEELALDFRRSMAAIDFRSATGQRFDSFALDIEARLVSPLLKRNRRILKLSRMIRNAVGERYPLGAITIPWFYEWGGPFPYEGLDQIYDVFLPMIYFGGRGNGAKSARLNTALNIQDIREGTGNPRTRVHSIGGIADELNAREVGAFVRTSNRRHAIGASLYDFFTSGPEDWERLALVR